MHQDRNLSSQLPELPLTGHANHSRNYRLKEDSDRENVEWRSIAEGRRYWPESGAQPRLFLF